MIHACQENLLASLGSTQYKRAVVLELPVPNQINLLGKVTAREVDTGCLIKGFKHGVLDDVSQLHRLLIVSRNQIVVMV